MENITCKICKITKANNDFRKKRKICRDCENAICREIRQTEKGKKLAHASQKKYKEKNKQEIDRKRKQKITCECGAIVSYHNLKRHTETPKHKMIIQNKI